MPLQCIYYDLIAFLGEHPTKTDLKVVDQFLLATSKLVTLRTFKAMKAQGEVRRHCARCHADFTDSDNSSGSYTIPHVFRTEPEFAGTSGWDKLYSYSSECCGYRVQVVQVGGGSADYQDLDRLGHCFEGRHTEYIGANNYNGINIFPCKYLASGECVREWLEAGRLEPLFNDRYDRH